MIYAAGVQIRNKTTQYFCNPRRLAFQWRADYFFGNQEKAFTLQAFSLAFHHRHGGRDFCVRQAAEITPLRPSASRKHKMAQAILGATQSAQFETIRSGSRLETVDLAPVILLDCVLVGNFRPYPVKIEIGEETTGLVLEGGNFL
jgi:hypothetical protein